jgi:hypothetical protein
MSGFLGFWSNGEELFCGTFVWFGPSDSFLMKQTGTPVPALLYTLPHTNALQRMTSQQDVSQQQQQQQQQENQPQPQGGATTGGQAILPRSTSSSSAYCDCFEPFGIGLGVISVFVLFLPRLVFLGRWWWSSSTVLSFLLTLGAVVCLFRAAKRYQNEQKRGLSSASSSASLVGVGWMVVSWMFCTVAGVMAIVDVISIHADKYSYYEAELLVVLVALVCMLIASVCMLIYAEKSRRKATGHPTQSSNVVVGDPEAPVHDEEPSVGITPPTVIAQEVLTQEAAEEQNINKAVEVLPTGSYYVPHNKDQCRSVTAPAPRAMVIADPIHDASRIVEQQHGQQRHRRAAIDP